MFWRYSSGATILIAPMYRYSQFCFATLFDSLLYHVFLRYLHNSVPANTLLWLDYVPIRGLFYSSILEEAACLVG